MILYIDFFSSLSHKQTTKFHGGGNYTRNLIQVIADKYKQLEICILCPEWYEVSFENEAVLVQYSNISWKNVSAVNDRIEYEKDSILWSPILSVMQDFKNILKIKNKRKDIKVCATIHDLRMLDICWDKDEKYYYSGVVRLLYPFKRVLVDYFATRIIKKLIMKKSVGCLDQIYTVSNYALQDIVKLNKNANVSWYYQSTIFNSEVNANRIVEGEYILFVSGQRILKNFSSALRGFALYKKKNREHNKRLVVTGIDSQTLNNLLSILGDDRHCIESNIISFEYVNHEDLVSLYKYCDYTLYLSKKEGFGLPIVEAAMYGKTSIVSNRTSIPEVLGASVKYVYPTNYQMIAEAMEYFESKEVRNRYEHRITEVLPIIRKRMEIEQQFLIDDLLADKLDYFD